MQHDTSSLRKSLWRGALGGLTDNPVALSLRQYLLVLVFACIALLIGYYFGNSQDAVFTACVALVGGYMALNIGANDVANSVGPIVGAKALPLGAALLLAAIAETAGALLAGAHVADRIVFRIVDQEMVRDPARFVIGMLSALIGAALWINMANLLRVPISTTHAIIGGIVGVTAFTIGTEAVIWSEISLITLGWLISPIISAAIAISILALIKSKLLGAQNKVRVARTWIPVLIAAMAALFTLFLIAKGLSNVWRPTTPVLVICVLGIFIATLVVCGPYIRRISMGLANRNQTVQALFRVPLIVAGGFLAFSHGANDIANIAGPVTAILHVKQTFDLSLSLGTPLWVLVVGTLGLSCGLLFFNSGMVRVVATRITRITPVRAYAIAAATASTVTAASWAAMPVSTTQIALGAIFGIGAYRELAARRQQRERALKASATRKKQRLLIRREDAVRILFVWAVTLPATSLISAALFWSIDLML